MKTNKIFIAALGLMTVGALTSCSESWLDVSSKTETTTGNYFKSETDANRALIGCYDGWQCTVSSGPTFAIHYATTLLSDECFGGTGNGDVRNSAVVDRMDLSQDQSQLNLFNDLWKYYYTAIYNCNELIVNDPNISWTSEESHGKYMGEARAIRGILYFDLVRLFERVPLLTAPTNDNVPQADPDSTYALVISDLKYAAEHIPADAYPKADAASNDGRITCYAAKAMLARVYLYYTGYYGHEPAGLTKAEALQGLEDVIASGEYKLVPQFKDLWPASDDVWTQDASGNWTEKNGYAGNGNSETVLSMKFNYTSDYNGNQGGNNAIQMFGIRGGIFKAPYGQGWGGATVTKAFAGSYPAGDQRRDASIIDLQAEGIAGMSAYQDKIADQREYTGYCVKKYTPRSGYHQDETSGKWTLTHYYDGVMAGDFQISQPQDYVLMRYADVLLMAAELGSPNAQKYVDMVHQRAYAIDNNGTIGGGYTRMGTSKEEIMEERRKEFAFEGIRYWDLMRQGIDVAAKTIATSETVLSGGQEETVTISAGNFTSKRGLMQIPQTQIQLSNGVLTQNAGW